MSDLPNRPHVSVIDGVVIDPQPDADHEFLVRHLTRRFWVDCWVIIPANRSTKAVKIKIPWITTKQDGPDAGKLHVHNSGYRFRWLRTKDDFTRLRKKVVSDRDGSKDSVGEP